jgi:hypothetical protein
MGSVLYTCFAKLWVCVLFLHMHWGQRGHTSRGGNGTAQPTAGAGLRARSWWSSAVPSPAAVLLLFMPDDFVATWLVAWHFMIVSDSCEDPDSQLVAMGLFSSSALSHGSEMQESLPCMGLLLCCSTKLHKYLHYMSCVALHEVC